MENNRDYLMFSQEEKQNRNFCTLVFFALLLFVFSCPGFGQNTPTAAESIEAYPPGNKLRGVIIGVSDYKYLDADLNYADEDAQLIYDLFSDHHDTDTSNLELLFDSIATNAESIMTRIYRILDDSKPNDVFVFYFAGHGDVQNTLGKPTGFLLLHEVSQDQDYYTGDVINVERLKGILNKAAENQVKVIVITDACRSGKLAGSAEGANATLTSLQARWGNMIKIVSCQTNQLSFESNQWGGGHGVFTYYLTKGLGGDATDLNADQRISLGELLPYLMTKVPMATEFNQTPMIVADNYDISLLNPPKEESDDSKSLIGEIKVEDLPYEIAFRGDNILNAGISPISQLYFRAFNRALTKNRIINNSARAVKPFEINLSLGSEKYAAISKKNEHIIANNINMVYSTGEDKVIRVWEVMEDKIQQKDLIKGIPSQITDLETFKNGDLLVGADYAGQVCFWDTQSMQKNFNINLNQGRIYDITIIPHNNKIVVAATKGVFAAPISEEGIGKNTLKKIEGIESPVKLIDASSDVIICGADDGNIYHLNTMNFEVKKKIKLGNNPITAIKISPDQELCVVGDSKSNIFYISLPEGKVVNKEYLGISTIKSIAIDRFSQNAFVSGSQHTTFNIEIKKGYKKTKIETPQSVVDSRFVDGFTKFCYLTFAWNSTKSQLGYMDISYQNNIPNHANEIFQLYSQSKEPEKLKDDMKYQYYLVLYSYAKTVLDPLLTGSDIVPKLAEIDKAIIYLNEAMKVFQDEVYFTDKLQIDMLLLEVFRIVVNNDLKQTKQALNKVNQLIKLQPRAAYPHNMLTSLYKRVYELEKAKNSAQVAIERIPTWTEPVVNLGKTYLKEGNYEKAIAEFEKVIELNPDISKGYINLAIVQTLQGEYPKAESNYQVALAKDSINPYILSSFANLELKRKNLRNAHALLAKSYQIDSTHELTNRLLAKCYTEEFLLSKTDTANLYLAHNHLLKNIREYSNNAENYNEMFDFFYQIAKHPESNLFIINKNNQKTADRSLSKLLQYYSNRANRLNLFSAKAYVNKATSSYLSAYRKNSKKHIKNLRNKLGQYPDANFQLGRYYHGIGKRGKAIKFYKNAIELNPQFFEAYSSLWELYAESGKTKMLDDLYKQIKVAFKESPEADFKFSVAKNNRVLLEKVLKENPNYTPARIYQHNLRFIKGETESANEDQLNYKRIAVFGTKYIKISRGKWLGLTDVFGNIVLSIDYESIDLNGKQITATKNGITSTINL